jgi:hypothetical protein
MSHFLLVTHGSDGDVLPFVAVGAALADAGHPVTLLTHAPYRAAATAAGLRFHPIDDETAFERTLADTPGLLGSAPDRLGWDAFYRRNGMFGQIAAECAALRALHRPGGTVLVGRHTSGVSVRFVGELTGAPVAWLALAPTQVMAAPVAAHTYGTELAAGFAEVRAGLGLPPVADWRLWFAGCDAVLGLWPRWFDEAGPRSPGWVETAGFPLADSGHQVLGERAADADATPPGSVVVTGGTGRMLHPGYYPALVEAAALTGLPTTLVVRHRDLLPRDLPPTVRWRPGARFAEVLPHAAALVHHGGIGTCARALAAGCPQVVMADGIDRPDNAARLARHGLARVLPADRWTPAALADAIRAAATDSGFRARARAVAGYGTGESGDGPAAVAAVARRLAALDRPVPGAAARLRALSAPDRARLRARLDAARAAAGSPGTPTAPASEGAAR